MPEEARKSPAIAGSRVATHQGVGGHAEQRRRTFQKHLLIFLVAGIGIAAIDAFVIAPPNVQWAQWFIIPWTFVFSLHVLGLKSRGFSWVELVAPPKDAAIKEVYTAPLQYEVVRARQLRDGLTNAAASIRDSHPELADAASAAADELLAAVEHIYSASSGDPAGGSADQLVPDAQAALTALDELHYALLRVGVLDDSPEVTEIDSVKERTESIRGLAR